MERFQVDRTTLANMINCGDDQDETASSFFKRISLETGVKICWPARLKPSLRKDPFIKIIGPEHLIQEAKAKVLLRMDSKNKVTLKMDVSYTDHSHVIGKGGKTIQSVMHDTGCHIHFPDSNRACQTVKSNQVTISGSVLAMENARSRIRELCPLIVTFNIPRISLVSCLSIEKVKNIYDLNITFKKTFSNEYLMIIRGDAQNISKLRDGIKMILHNFTDCTNSVIPISTVIEITPGHHTFVLDELKKYCVESKTGTTIKFPEQDTYASTIDTQSRNSSVTITGPVDGVLRARVWIVGCLPLAMIFDLDCNNISLNTLLGNMDEFNVIISLRPKQRSPDKVVVIKTAEMNSKCLIEARNKLMNISTELMNLKNNLSVEKMYEKPISPPLPISNVISNYEPHSNNIGVIGGELKKYKDYELKRSLAYKAVLNKPSAGVKRVPTDKWSGLGFSLSSNDTGLAHKFGAMKIDNWDNSLFNRSASIMMFKEPARMPDTSVSEWLWKNNLHKYANVFQSHDVKTFEDVYEIEEKDLVAFGISSGFDRKRIMKLIEEVKET